jgi:hypothetical protein
VSIFIGLFAKKFELGELNGLEGADFSFLVFIFSELYGKEALSGEQSPGKAQATKCRQFQDNPLVALH